MTEKQTIESSLYTLLDIACSSEKESEQVVALKSLHGLARKHCLPKSLMNEAANRLHKAFLAAESENVRKGIILVLGAMPVEESVLCLQQIVATTSGRLREQAIYSLSSATGELILLSGGQKERET